MSLSECGDKIRSLSEVKQLIHTVMDNDPGFAGKQACLPGRMEESRDLLNDDFDLHFDFLWSRAGHVLCDLLENLGMVFC